MAKGKEKLDRTCKILELPECVLRILFSYLDNTSLFLLSQTCRYFEYFIEDPVFWRYIDARREPNTTEKVSYCCDKIHEKTTHVFIRAKDKNSGQVPSNFFEYSSRFNNLTVLALENQRFIGTKLSLRDFPASLEELSLRKTHIKSSEYFFRYSTRTMENLRVLILDGCKWVTCSFLMSVMKFENLEIISAVKCIKLHLNMVPYLNVARVGCNRKLKIFDCRFTGIGHELLRSFYAHKTVQSLYFQSLKSAEVDYGENIFNRNYMRSVTYPNEDNPYMDGNICDASLNDYVRTTALDSVEPICSSILYQDPYPKCTCNYKATERATAPEVPEMKEDYYLYEPPRRQLRKFVCLKHFKDVQKLPVEFKEFFVANEKQFYSGTSSDADSDYDSSDSDSDNTCCMYGMGRRMVLLTPGSNNESVREEVLELNHDDRRDRPNVSIFIASPLGEFRNTNTQNQGDGPSDAAAIPSTSRGVSENSINENLENARTEEAKRKHDDDSDDQDCSQPNKKVKKKEVEKLINLSEEVQEAQVNELVESATDMGNRLNRFLQNSMNRFKERFARSTEGGPSTSRIENPAESVNGNMRSRFQDAQTKVCVIIPPKNESLRLRDCRRGNPENTGPRRSVFREYNHNLQLSDESVANLPTSNRLTLYKAERLLTKSKMVCCVVIPPENDITWMRFGLRRPAEDTFRGSHDFSRQRFVEGIGRVEFVRPPPYALENFYPVGIHRERAHRVAPFPCTKEKISLRRLSLRGFRRITDTGLNFIKNLNIDLLDLTYTSVTKEGIENFLVHNPSCRIVHPLYCVCTPINPLHDLYVGQEE